jgi:hypothetical protein
LGAALGLAALAGAGFLVFFEVAAIGLRYHPASGGKTPHPIEGMFQLRRELWRATARVWHGDVDAGLRIFDEH